MMPPQFTEGKFSSFDGTKLHFRYLSIPGAQETLVIHHGHGEHSGRYEKFADHFKNENINIAVLDARGHGRSEGIEVYVDSFEDYIHDLDRFVAYLGSEKKMREPFYLLGHSNGALVSIHWALQNPSRLKALFLSSPYLGIRLPQAILRLNQGINFLFPKFIYKNPVYPPHLTHNLAEVEQYKKDTFIRRRISSRLLSEMIRYQKKLKSVAELKFPFPVYIMMAGLEKVVDSRETDLLYQKLQVPDKDLKVFHGFYHEIFNELNQSEVFEALRGYLARARSLPKKVS